MPATVPVPTPTLSAAAPSSVAPIIKMIPLAMIEVNAGTRMRVSLNEKRIDDLVKAMEEGAQIPPITVYEAGSKWRPYVRSDGWHRCAAARKLGLREILAEIRQGTVSDAVLAAVGANPEGSLPYSRADRRRCVEALLLDPEWGRRFSDSDIARRAGVSHKTVAAVRKAILGNSQDGQRLVKRGGTTYEMSVANIGKRTAPDAAPRPKRWIGPPGAFWSDLQSAIDRLRQAEAAVSASHPELAQHVAQWAAALDADKHLMLRDVEAAERGTAVRFLRLLDTGTLAWKSPAAAAPETSREQALARFFGGRVGTIPIIAPEPPAESR